MSDVEKFWTAVAAKFGVSRSWQDLNSAEQMQVITGINMILGVLR